MSEGVRGDFNSGWAVSHGGVFQPLSQIMIVRIDKFVAWWLGSRQSVRHVPISINQYVTVRVISTWFCNMFNNLLYLLFFYLFTILVKDKPPSINKTKLTYYFSK